MTRHPSGMAALALTAVLLAGDGGLSAARPALTTAPLAGINLAGGEFNAKRKPGTYGKDYVYPTKRTAAPFLAGGMQIVRIPVLWERLQPTPGAPLDAAEMARLDKAFAQLGAFRIIVLDVHNYGKLAGERLDRVPGGADKLADLWRRLADRYRADPRIAFGLMNEPNGIAPRDWRVIVDRSVAAIRATGARNLLLVPGANWTGAHSWTAGGPASNAAAFTGFRDPANHFAIEMHQYLDADNSGTGTSCVDPAAAARRMQPATAWLRRNRYRGFLGEFGAPASSPCLNALSALLDQVRQAPDAWMGWAYWAGGEWWGAYPMSAQPSKTGPKPQMAVLTRFAGRSAR